MMAKKGGVSATAKAKAKTKTKAKVKTKTSGKASPRKPRAGTPKDWPARLRMHIAQSIATKERLLADCEADILAAAKLMSATFKHGGKILLCGNGGSAADCQHIAAELVSSLYSDKKKTALPALALTTDTSFLTAYSNDFGYEGVFARQIEALGTKGDLLIAISTSGASANVVEAAKQARSAGLRIVGLTGEAGAKLAGLSDVCIKVPSRNTQHVQEAHITIGHILCELAQ